MTRIFKSLLGRHNEPPSPEEIEAHRVANEALQSRVNMIARQRRAEPVSYTPTTDIYGRALQ